jgi:hypothetical protein
MLALDHQPPMIHRGASRRNGAGVRLITRKGNDFTSPFSQIAVAMAALLWARATEPLRHGRGSAFSTAQGGLQYRSFPAKELRVGHGGLARMVRRRNDGNESH